MRIVEERESELHVAKGDRFTCTRGHHVGFAGRDGHVGEVVTPDLFQDMQGPTIQLGDRFGLCRCGAFWARFGRLHTEMGWGRTHEMLWHPEMNAVVDSDAPEFAGVLRHGIDHLGTAVAEQGGGRSTDAEGGVADAPHQNQGPSEGPLR